MIPTSFEGLPEEDLNNVWKILTQLQSSNPTKYEEFITHIKLEQEKADKLSKIIPKAHSVYIVEVTRLDEKFICYVNVMSWERIKYPLADKPVSLMIGRELTQTRKSELICHVAANGQVLDEVSQSESDVQKEFRILLNKFLSDNYKEYRFYSNKMKRFERRNQSEQYYGQLPEDPKDLFIQAKKQKNLSTNDIIELMKTSNINDEDVETDETKGPKNIVEALEEEIKKAITPDDDTFSTDHSRIPREAKNPEPETGVLIEEVQDAPKPAPKFKIDDSNKKEVKIFIRLDKKTKLSEIDPQISVNRLVLKINKETSLDIKLPMNLKDEATHAKFTKKTDYLLLTIKIPKLESLEPKKEPDMFDDKFVKNIQKAFSPCSSVSAH